MSKFLRNGQGDLVGEQCPQPNTPKWKGPSCSLNTSSIFLFYGLLLDLIQAFLSLFFPTPVLELFTPISLSLTLFLYLIGSLSSESFNF